MSNVCKETEFTNMVMVEDKKTGKVLVQKRVQYWCGIAFPGGHVEDGESFTESAAREVFEETGLTVKNLVLCGTVNWVHMDDNSRYVVLCYKTDDFSGEILDETEEGKVFWVDKDKLKNMDLCPHFEDYLKIFLGEAVEFYGKDYRGEKENTFELL